MFAFDLISDLHVDTWPKIDFQGLATAPVCVVAGDVGQDSTDVKQFLKHLARCYQAVFYIDGNTEHRDDWNQLGQSYKRIDDITQGIKDLVYLQNNVVIINGVAILGTNGWWTWDFDSNIEVEQSQAWWISMEQCSGHVPEIIDALAQSDVNYLVNSVTRLQKHADVKKIILVTHTVPHYQFLQHDISLAGSHRINVMGNSQMPTVLEADTENKISHWCFGHYHSSTDVVLEGIRYVSNCRGRKDTPHSSAVYYPLRIEVDV